MIQERYCSYEAAKLLKEKGFNEAFTYLAAWIAECCEKVKKGE